MAKEFINGKSACTKLGCSKDFFKHLVEIGAIEAEREENGGWKVSRESVDNFRQELSIYLDRDYYNQIQELTEEVESLKEQIRQYKGILQQIKGIIPEEIYF